jgi:hypothetical protein
MEAGRRAVATARLDAAPASIMAFEDFVDAMEFLKPGERDRILIAGGEILDNIIKHSSPIERRRIVARVHRGKSSILLAFYFRADSFAAFAAEEALFAAPSPLFDPAHRRWRGIGLVMCRNLARRVSFRPGSIRDRIFLEFTLN